MIRHGYGSPRPYGSLRPYGTLGRVRRSPPGVPLEATVDPFRAVLIAGPDPEVDPFRAVLIAAGPEATSDPDPYQAVLIR